MVRAGAPCCLARSMVLVKLPGFFFAFPSVSVASSEVQMYFAQPRPWPFAVFAGGFNVCLRVPCAPPASPTAKLNTDAGRG